MRTSRFLSCLTLAALLAGPAVAQISLTALGSPYTQDFNTLPVSGSATFTNNVTIPGWYSVRTGTGTTIVANDGSSNAGNLYSYGTGTAADRALGTVGSGNAAAGSFFHGVRLANNTGSTITTLNVSYTGEQWRNSAAAAQTVAFSYLVGSPSVTGSLAEFQSAGVAFAGLNFVSPVTGGTAGALNGNSASNRTAITGSITGLNIPSGTEVMLRWSDPDHPGNDHGLAIDDFSVTPQGAAAGTTNLSINDLSANEGNSGTSNFTFTVSLSAPAGPGGVTFDIATADGTASSASDYAAKTLTAQSIPQGNSTYQFTVLVNGDTVNESNETFFVNVTNVTGATVLDGQGQGTILNDDVACTPTTTISQIQGSGASSPLVNTAVSTSGIVTLLRSNGFFMQMPSPGDGDSATSDGIFVLTSSAPSVSVGDAACVMANVTEFSSTSPTDPVNSLTQLNGATVFVLSSGNTLPAPVTLNPDPNGAKDQLERYEGMRVQAANMDVVGPTGGTVNEANATAVSNGAFWAVVQGTNRPFREPGLDVTHPIDDTAAGTIPRFDSNPERIQIFTNAPGTTKIDVAAGAHLSGVVGVLDVFFGDYELDVEPATVPTVTNNSLTYTAVPPPLASELTIATANLERFFDTTDDPAVSDVVLTPAAFNNRLAKASLEIRHVLKSPDVVAVEEMENLSTLQTLAARISSDAIAAGESDPQYSAYLVEGNDIGGIDVGFLANPNRIVGVTVTQFGAADTYTDPNTGKQATLNDRPPLLLTGTAHNGAAVGLPFAVFANHLKALPSDDPTDSRVRVKRNAQAVFLANLIQARQVANPNELILSLGDYNAFEFNDGTADVIGVVRGTPAPSSQVLVDPGAPIVTPTLTELSAAFLPAAQRYSYSFGGNAQSLDHILVNSKVLPRVSRFAIGRVNADFPGIYRNDATRPERISDHDPELAYVTLPAAIDVTGSTSYVASGLILNRATGLYNGTVTVTNKSGATIAGPVQFAFVAMPAGVTLANASGNLAGTPYITSQGALAPGASVTVPVQFRVQGTARVGYTLNVYSGTL